MRAFSRMECFSSESAGAIFRRLPVVALALLFLVGSIGEAEARSRRHHRQHAVINTHGGHKVGGHRIARGGYTPPYAEIVYDVNAAKVLTSVNPDAPRHPASITKVMTLYILFEQLEKGVLSLDSELNVSAHAAAQAPSKLGLRPGSTIEVEDAIKAIVTRSANDVAVTIGENISGSEDAFAELMTRKAKAIGMRNTLFRNASGLPDPEQLTTARDLATLGRVIQDRFPKYYKYFSTRSFAFNGSVIGNHNRLLGRVEGVDGIKTGYTRASGFNLLTSAKIDGHHVIAVVLGGRSGRARDNQMAALLETHMPDSSVGGRRNVQIAEVEDETPAPRVVIPAIAPPVVAKPIERPRPAVVAELTRQEPVSVPAARPELPVLKGAIKTQQLPRLNGSGATTVQVGATPPVIASTTPVGPALRWIKGNQPKSLADADPRIGQPTAPAARKALGLRAEADLDADTGLTTASVQSRAAIPVAEAAPVQPSRIEVPAKIETTKIEPTKVEAIKAEAIKADAGKAEIARAPARSGWIIQLAATDDESKALAILSDARTKNKGVLNRAESFTEKVQKGGAVLYRARFAGFAAPEAEAACKALKRSGYACFAQYIQF